jgi:ATP-dependent exoDNAse (exonuclease V) alpha subunit
MLERQILEYADRGQDAARGLVPKATVERAIAKRPRMTDEQAEVVRRLTGDGAAVAVVVGQAGTGKTFALAAAREAWQAAGKSVIGVALARRAARELQDSSGIPSMSVAALLEGLRARPLTGIAARSVLVVDEAGMVSTRQLAELVEHADRARAKLVVVGGHRQLAEIEAGGAFRALASRLPAIELTENRRQVAQWERDALEQLRDGDARTALGRYEAHGRVAIADSADDVRARLVADWWAARDPGRTVMIAFRRVDVADLNRRARTLMRTEGHLGPTELELPGGRFAVGDRVSLRRNDSRIGVANGDRGVVADVDPRARTLAVDIGARRVRLDAAYVERISQRTGPSLAHGYAITGHSAQGLTCDRAFVLVTNEASREWCYTALSRGRISNQLYAVAREPSERDEYAPTSARLADPREVLAAALTRSDAQTLATDAGATSRLAQALGRAKAELDAAERAARRATRDRAELERHAPHPLALRARARHTGRLAEARTVEGAARARRDELQLRVGELQERLAAERRAARPQPDLQTLQARRRERVARRAVDRGFYIDR